MSSIVNSQEREVSMRFEFSAFDSSLLVNKPCFILLLDKLLLIIPHDSLSPGFTTSPIADEIFISIVDQNWNSTIEKALQIVAIVVLAISNKS